MNIDEKITHKNMKNKIQEGTQKNKRMLHHRDAGIVQNLEIYQTYHIITLKEDI